jgi:hypothetical protein
MRYALECDVEGKVRFKQKTKVSWGKKTIYFDRDDAGMLNKIRIEGPVPDDEKIVARVEQRSDGIPQISEEGGGRIHRELIAELQALESVFAYYYNLKRVRWDAVTCIAVPETREEEALLEFNNTKITRNPLDPITDVDLDNLPRLVKLALRCKHLASPLAFHREGRSDIRNLRFITAYFSYYFVLEGLYGNGKTKNDAIEAEFKRSRVLHSAIQQCMDHGFPATAMSNVYTVEGLLASKGKKLTLDNIIWLLVRTRGDLHHFVNSPTRDSGTPFTHERYELLALFIAKLSQLVLLEEINQNLM